MSTQLEPMASLLIPCHQPVPQHLHQLSPLQLSPLQDRLDDVRSEAGERQDSRRGTPSPSLGQPDAKGIPIDRRS